MQLLIFSSLLWLIFRLHGISGSSCSTKSEFEIILQNAKLLDCENQPAQFGCSWMYHLSLVAKEGHKELSDMIARISIAIVTSDQLAQELRTAWNSTLEVQVTRHLAFIGAMRCSNSNSKADGCRQLRSACSGLEQHHIYLLSGFCSETITCAPIGTQSDLDGRPTIPQDLASYVAFRLLERQAFIAKALGEIQLASSSESEYSIMNELQSSHGDQLLDNNKRLAMFVTWPIKTSAYYHIFSLFLDAALTLRELFSFHVVTTRLSRISSKSKRPSYRYLFEDHKAYLAVYSKEICHSKSAWPFNCVPRTATADQLLTPEQFSGFLLHQTLTELSLTLDRPALRIPAFAKTNAFLDAFVRSSGFYVLVVVPSEEALIDPLFDWEKLNDIVGNLGAWFRLNFYSVAVTKPCALDLLSQLNSGVQLADDICEKLCFVIQMPGGGQHLLSRYDPVTKLEEEAQQAISRSKWYHASAKLSLDNIESFSMAELPGRLTGCGHFGGGACGTGGGLESRLLENSGGEVRTDAFVEQASFSEVYNVTDVLVVEKRDELLSGFLNLVGQEKPWMVLFTVSWSPRCKAARAVWSSVGQCIKRVGINDIQLAQVDCFEANALCNYLKIDTYPTIVMFKKSGRSSTYTGPLTLERLCAYANLALVPLFIPSTSSGQTQDLLGKFLPLMSRVFVYSGSTILESVIDVGVETRFQEAVVFEQVTETEEIKRKFTVYYHEAQPKFKEFIGNLNSSQELKAFMMTSHLETVFPCSWIYVAQALNTSRPLYILLTTGTLTDPLRELLHHLGNRLIPKGAIICYLEIHKQTSSLDDVLQRLAGYSLPAIVALPPDRAVTHRLALAPLELDSLIVEASSWAEKALSGGHMSSGHPVDSPDSPWVPSGTVYNFVAHIYESQASMTQSFPALHPGGGRLNFEHRLDGADFAKMNAGSTEYGSGSGMNKEILPEATESGPKGAIQPGHDEL